MLLRVRVKRQNISDSELAKALTGLIQQEGITTEVHERLEKSDHEEPIPEKYIQVIADKMQSGFRLVLNKLTRNIDAWFAYQAKVPKKKFLRKADKPNPLVLSQEQIDELRMLIESHFKKAVGFQYKVPEEVQKKWNKIGIEKTDENLEKWITQSYVAGRLADVLTNQSTYAEMIKQAKKLPLSRADQLIIDAAKKNAAKYVVGFGRRLADLSEDMLNTQHKSAIHDVVQRYFSGELTHTLYNEEGFTPQEAEALLSTKKAVKGWRELSTELKNRFKAVDVGRDWDRIAVSEVRFATNLGRIMNIQVEGGGDPEEIEVYYHVQPTACKYCKKLFLSEDGTPKIFKLSEILRNIQETGGMQIGLKAGLIGEEGGWVANATCHANGHCFPVRKIPEYSH